jgi:hypothetical protein
MPVVRTRSAPPAGSVFRQPLPTQTPRRSRVFTFATRDRNGARTHPNTPESPTLRIRPNRKRTSIRFRGPPELEGHKRADSDDLDDDHRDDDLKWAVDFSIFESGSPSTPPSRDPSKFTMTLSLASLYMPSC